MLEATSDSDLGLPYHAPKNIRTAKGPANASVSSEAGIMSPNDLRLTTNIYPIRDVEARAEAPSSRITVRNHIEQSSYRR